jgi:DNA-binding NtrC family response regulator
MPVILGLELAVSKGRSKAMMRKTPSITHPRSATPDFSPRRREDLPTPAVMVVSQDSLLRWALYEALTTAGLRVLSCSDEPHAREVLPQVETDFALALIDDDTWPMTKSEHEWLHLRWPHLPIVVLAHPGQGLEYRVEELGLTEVVLKPFDVPHLVQLVERIIAAPVRTRRDAEPHAAA